MAKIRPVDCKDYLRIGSNNDGGYVIPKVALDACNLLVSLGYGNNSDFERQFIHKSLINKVDLYESSISLRTVVLDFIRSLKSVRRDKRAFPIYRFKCLVLFLQTLLTRNLRYFNKTVVSNLKLLDSSEIEMRSILLRISNPKTTMIKIDIEGGEYDCLDSVLDLQKLANCSCLVIEFHQIPQRIESFYKIIDSLSKSFAITNIHINNFEKTSRTLPQVLEIVFTNRSLLSGDLEFFKQIPHQLDRPCNPKAAEVLYNYV